MNSKNIKPLSKILFPVKEDAQLEKDRFYKQVTIRLNHKGVVERGEKKGSEISSQQFIAKEGQFIISRIDARNGAMGIVPHELDGAIVTNDFLLFDFDEDEVDLKYFRYLSSTKWFDKQCKLASEGSTNRVRLKLGKFLSTNVYLPVLPIQQKIVESLDKIKFKSDQAIQLRVLAEKETEVLKESFLKEIFDTLAEEFGTIAIGQTELDINPNSVNPTVTFGQSDFTYVDIGSVEQKTGKIISTKFIKGINAPSRARRLMKQNNVVMASVRPNLKKCFVVNERLHNQVCSTGFTILIGNEDYIVPEFLRYQLISDFFVRQCNVTGGHYPAINDDNLKKVRLVIPPTDEQNRILAEINAMDEKIQQIRNHQRLINIELKALFPSILDKAFKGEW